MFFSLAYFLNQLVSNLRYKTSFPKNPNHEFLQGQQCLIVRYVSAARLYNFFMPQNLDYKVFTMR